MLSGRLAHISKFFVPEESPMVRRTSPRHHRPVKSPGRPRARLLVELLEDRRLLSGSQRLAVFSGIPPASTLDQQTQAGQDLLRSSGLSEQDVLVVGALDLTGTFLVQTPADATPQT